MKLLVVTQALDLDEPVLSTYHDWVAALAGQVNQIEAICLKEGRHTLPANVHVHTLGKETGRKSPFLYALRFLHLSWKLRREYDAVFVHMNQEYILISGLLWKLLGKRVYLWRNHYAGSWLTDVAALFCTKVFCTSKHSYTAKYKKTVLMPVGVDTDRFSQNTSVPRVPRSILFFARIAPSKRPDMFIEALGLLKKQEIPFVASIYGSPLPSNNSYYESLKARVQELELKDVVTFYPGVPNSEAPLVYAAHEINVNCSPSGMFDKMLFEAAASGCIVLAESEDFKDAAGEQFHHTNDLELAERLKDMLAVTRDERTRITAHMASLARSESLASLCDRLSSELYS